MLCKVGLGELVLYGSFEGKKSTITELVMPSLGDNVNKKFYSDEYISAYQAVAWSELTSLRKITIDDGARFVGLNLRENIPSLIELEFKNSVISANTLECLLDMAPNINRIDISGSSYFSHTTSKEKNEQEEKLNNRIAKINLNVNSNSTIPEFSVSARYRGESTSKGMEVRFKKTPTTGGDGKIRMIERQDPLNRERDQNNFPFLEK